MKIFHADHGLTPAEWGLVKEAVEAHEGFFIAVLALPADTAVKSALYGPSVGDEPIAESEVSYSRRGDRPGESRMVNRPQRTATHLVIIGFASADPAIYTAYGTTNSVVAPREPFDTTLSVEERAASEAFWREHALAP